MYEFSLIFLYTHKLHTYVNLEKKISKIQRDQETIPTLSAKGHLLQI